MILGTASSLIPSVVDMITLWLERRRRRQSVATASASAQEVLPLGGQASYDISPPWIPDVLHRIMQLAMLPSGWDSYGGRKLDPKVASTFVAILQVLAPAVQSKPRISLTGNGGLVATWSTGGKMADITLEPGREPTFSYEDNLTDFEWDGPLMADDQRVEKWLWRASV